MILPTTAEGVTAFLQRGRQTPQVHDQSLVLPPHVSIEILRSLKVLHTGVRAILSNRPWYGCSCTTGWITTLSPEHLIPGWVGLVCVAGDKSWHRLPELNRSERARFWTEVPEPKPNARANGRPTPR